MGATGTRTSDGSFATWGDGRSHSRNPVAISRNPLTCREMLSSQVPCFDKLRWCIRILRLRFNTREAQKQKLFKIFFCGFDQVFAARVLYNSAPFLYLVCVSALSIRLQFGGKAMFGVLGCFSKCNMLQS